MVMTKWQWSTNNILIWWPNSGDRRWWQNDAAQKSYKPQSSLESRLRISILFYMDNESLFINFGSNILCKYHQDAEHTIRLHSVIPFIVLYFLMFEYLINDIEINQSLTLGIHLIDTINFIIKFKIIFNYVPKSLIMPQCLIQAQLIIFHVICFIETFSIKS